MADKQFEQFYSILFFSLDLFEEEEKSKIMLNGNAYFMNPCEIHKTRRGTKPQ